MWNEEVHWSGRFHVCSVDSYWYLIWILYRKLDFNLLLLKVVYCQTRTDLYRGFLRHLKSLSDTCLKIFKNGKTQVPLFLHDVKTHDKNVSLCDNIPNRSKFFLLTLELSLISKTCSLSIQCMKTLWTYPVLSTVYISTIQYTVDIWMVEKNRSIEARLTLALKNQVLKVMKSHLMRAWIERNKFFSRSSLSVQTPDASRWHPKIRKKMKKKWKITNCLSKNRSGD